MTQAPAHDYRTWTLGQLLGRQQTLQDTLPLSPWQAKALEAELRALDEAITQRVQALAQDRARR